MTDHLAEARKFAYSTDRASITVDWAQVNAQLASAHAAIALTETMDRATNALIAIAELMSKTADFEEAQRERAEIVAEREARRAMEIMP